MYPSWVDAARNDRRYDNAEDLNTASAIHLVRRETDSLVFECVVRESFK